jgi:hypothetical protein
MYDIVYILKKDVSAEELRYSLRSVCENFPYRKIWFYCGCPEGITPDEYVPFEQKGVAVWEKTTSTVEAICKNKNITEDFYLFNDDFFIMKPVEDMPIYYDKTLFRRIEQIKKRRGGAPSLYTRQLGQTRDVLMEDGYKTFNYAVHMPMLINRKDALKVIRKYPKLHMFRSVYGNVCNVGGEQHADVKIVKKSIEPDKDCDFLSTGDGDMSESAVGRFIMERFPNPCKYEDKCDSAVLGQRTVDSKVLGKSEDTEGQS